MPHGNTVIDGDGVEFGSVAAQFLNLLFHQLAGFVQMRVSRDKLCERIGNGYDGLPEMFALHAVGHP